MKYYVLEKRYDKNGKVISESRATGDTTDIAWAKQRMESLFQAKLIELRHEIKPGDITYGARSCSLGLKDGRYELKIEEVQTCSTAKDILLAFSKKYEGDYDRVLTAIGSHEDPPFGDPVSLRKYLSANDKQGLTILDESYPEYLKRKTRAPFVIYHDGNLALLGPTHPKLAVSIRRNAPYELLSKMKKDIANLPSKVVIVTSCPEIIDACINPINGVRHRVILVKACGLDSPLPRITKTQEVAVKVNGGLIVTPFPDNTLCTPLRFLQKNYLLVGLCDYLWVVCGEPKSAVEIQVNIAANYGTDVLVYPTWPEYDNLYNNKWISEGAAVVENANDIKRMMKL